MSLAMATMTTMTTMSTMIMMMTATSAAFIAFQIDTTLTDAMALCFSKQFEQHYAG